MSEEQSGFKVTDRRLFNPDGTPREVERPDPADQPVEAGSDTSTASDSSKGAPSSASATDERASAGGVEGGARSAARARRDDEYDESHAERGIPGADDPASFINFLMSIASNAAASLGMMEHPVTGERGGDIQLAKHWI